MAAPTVDALFGFRVGERVRILYQKPNHEPAPYAGLIVELHGKGIGKRGRVLENRLTLVTEKGKRSFVESGIHAIAAPDRVVYFV
mgnify:CR=1 FL=1